MKIVDEVSEKMNGIACLLKVSRGTRGCNDSFFLVFYESLPNRGASGWTPLSIVKRRIGNMTNALASRGRGKKEAEVNFNRTKERRKTPGGIM